MPDSQPERNEVTTVYPINELRELRERYSNEPDSSDSNSPKSSKIDQPSKNKSHKRHSRIQKSLPNTKPQTNKSPCDAKETYKGSSKNDYQRAGIHPKDTPSYCSMIDVQLKKISNRLGIDLQTLLIIGVVIVIFFLVGSYILFMDESGTRSQNNHPRSDREQMVQRFEKNLHPFVVDFTNQPRRLWQTVKAASKAVLRDRSPTQPAVLLLAATRQDARTARCLAHLVASCFTAAYDSAEEIQHFTLDDYVQHPAQLKKHLDSRLNNAFQKGSRAVVVNDVHAISGKAAMIFHAFCDNENAPYKDVSIVFTVVTDDVHSSNSAAKVEEYLYEMWQEHLDVDMLSSLLSRIANNVVLVQNEPDNVLDKYC